MDILFRNTNQRSETKSPLNSYLQMKKSFHTKAFQPQNFKVTKADSLDYGVGDTVRHIKFGVGIVKDIVEGGRDYEVTVDFDKVGVKKCSLPLQNLRKYNFYNFLKKS